MVVRLYGDLARRRKEMQVLEGDVLRSTLEVAVASGGEWAEVFVEDRRNQ